MIFYVRLDFTLKCWFCRCGYDSRILRFGVQLITDKPCDIYRQFVLSYYLSDDTISVFENSMINSGKQPFLFCTIQIQYLIFFFSFAQGFSFGVDLVVLQLNNLSCFSYAWCFMSSGRPLYYWAPFKKSASFQKGSGWQGKV